MVQRKVQNKLGIQANSLKTEKRQTNTKFSPQSLDGKSKGADLKAKKMKKSRSSLIKRSEVDITLLSPPAKTPSPQKPISPNKSPYGSPNYMKSTSSSEARKEQTKVTATTSSTSKLHSVAKKTPSRTSKTSSLKKVRTLTKVPSFKHRKAGGNINKCSKKVVLCEDDLDLKRATCSSNLKDSKFPSYLKLNPGATEVERTSVVKVCPYSYCSLNGHYHHSAPPLKRFLSSRRRLLKTQKVVEPELVSPRKEKPSQEKSEQHDDFFVEIHVPERETDFQDDLDNHSEDTVQDQELCKSFYSGGDQEVDNSTNASSDECFGENFDMEWEEGQISAAYLDDGLYVMKDDVKNAKNGDESDFKLQDFFADKMPPYYCQEEIAEWQIFSDADSLPGSESTQPGEEQLDEPIMGKEDNQINLLLEDGMAICSKNMEVKSTDAQYVYFSDTIEDTTEAETDGDESLEGNFTGGEIAEAKEQDADIAMNEKNLAEDMIEDIPSKTEDENEGVEPIVGTPRNTEEQDDSSTVKLDNCVAVEIAPDTDEINKTANLKISGRDIDSEQELLDSCSKLKGSMRNKKVDEASEEAREFNPRGPNFLPIEPDPEAEKVDLRHQDIDERRNADEWMLDYALRKTVNQLGRARKNKVALLIEAFEAVIPPMPKFEPHLRRKSSDFAHARPMQACS